MARAQKGRPGPAVAGPGRKVRAVAQRQRRINRRRIGANPPSSLTSKLMSTVRKRKRRTSMGGRRSRWTACSNADVYGAGPRPVSDCFHTPSTLPRSGRAEARPGQTAESAGTGAAAGAAAALGALPPPMFSDGTRIS